MNDYPEAIESEEMAVEINKIATKSDKPFSKKRKQRRTKNSAKSPTVSSSSSVDIAPIMESSDITHNSHKILQDMCTLACQFQRHADREKLTYSDVRKASNFYEFGRKLTVDIDKDVDIDLETNEDKITACDGTHKNFYCSRCLHCPGVDSATDLEIDDNLKKYFTLTIKAISSNESELLAICLPDLKKNSFISPLLPFFIQNLCNELTLLKYDPEQLKKVLRVLHSLYLNPNIYFRNKYLYKVLNYVISCATNNLPSVCCSFKENFSMRDTALEFLNVLIRANPTNNQALFEFALKKLENVFQNDKLNLFSFYGSLASINTLGFEAVAHILPLIFMNSNVYDTFKKSKIKETENGIFYNMVDKLLLDMCKCFLSYHVIKVIKLMDSSEFKVIFREPDEAFLFEDMDDVPLNFSVCLIILDYLGETLSLYLPSIMNKSNEKVSLEKLFEMKLQEGISSS